MAGDAGLLLHGFGDSEALKAVGFNARADFIALARRGGWRFLMGENGAHVIVGPRDDMPGSV